MVRACSAFTGRTRKALSVRHFVLGTRPTGLVVHRVQNGTLTIHNSVFVVGLIVQYARIGSPSFPKSLFTGPRSRLASAIRSCGFQFLKEV